MGNKENGISRRKAIELGLKAFASVMAAPYLESVSNLPPLPTAELDQKNKDWEHFQPGDQVFAMAKGPCTIYGQTDLNGPTLPNLVMDTYADKELFDPPTRNMITDGTTLRLRRIDDDWGQILMQEGISTPFTFPASDTNYYFEPYVRLEDFDPIPQLEAINFLPNTKPQDKEIVIVHYPSPHVFLIEGDQIVAHFPIILGAAKTPTPYGDFHINAAKISTHMLPGFVGVGFCLEVVKKAGIWLHNSPWWNWKKRLKGGYGSHGCGNLPDAEWQTISINGREISMAEVVFRWALTNLPEYDQKKVEYVRITSKDPCAAYPLPVHVVAGVEALKWVTRANPDLNWDKVLAQARALGETEWIIPQY